MSEEYREHLSLGIDCGGTYTDAVIYDLDDGEVIASAKYPTDHRDLTRCIDGVLDSLPPELLERVCLASLSTTLATNAIVESRGGKACLILIGYTDKIPVVPFGARVVRLDGGHDTRGDEMAPLDEAGLRAAVTENRDWADAFAISGYFSVRNPDHEIRARSISTEETDKPVVCGHELSMRLDAPRRATTAAINARLVPLITKLFASVRSIFQKRGIQCPLMVVRGDGTLMGVEMALERPVETILSGPAASVVGALRLSGRREGVVIDVGGTTTDIAWVKDGIVPVSDGAVVGGMATRVEAIDIRTIGLGGDSWIKLNRDGGMEIGPRRVLPIALLQEAEPVLNDLEKVRDSQALWSVSDLMTFWAKADGDKTSESGGAHVELERRLDLGPVSHLELKSSDSYAEAFLRLIDLEREGSVLRASLTPTDIFNAAGESEVGNSSLSRAAVEAASKLVGVSPTELIESVKERTRGTIAQQVLAFLLGVEEKDKTLLEMWMRGSPTRCVNLELRLDGAILAAGAPASLFLTPVSEFLSSECVTPQHMEVANAVGAVAGVVSHREELILRRQYDETYRVFASDGRYDFPDLVSATEFATGKARELAAEAARLAGAGELDLSENVRDFTVTDPRGITIVPERKVEVRAFGRPRLS